MKTEPDHRVITNINYSQTCINKSGSSTNLAVKSREVVQEILHKNTETIVRYVKISLKLYLAISF